MNRQKPFKVLHVVGAMNRGGTETLLMNIFRNMDRDNIQFDFVSYSQKEAAYDQEIKRLGGRVIRLSKPQSIKELYQVMKTKGPYDAVHAHTLFHCGIANLAAFLAGVKIRIAHAHTTMDNERGYSRKVYAIAMRSIIRICSTNLLACSRNAGNYLFGDKVLSSSKYTYFPNAIDYTNFLKEPSTAVKVFKMKEGLGNNIIIGHIGRFIEPKNHHFLLEVMKNILLKNPDAKLLLVGDGDLREEIEEQAKTKGMEQNIHFTGLRDDIATMLHSMDVFVFPSVYEGLGLVLLEAQASGVPCIVSEAIQPEADLDLGLITKLSLKGRAEVWADEILKTVNKKEKDTDKIIQSFKHRQYALDTGIANLYRIYQFNGGEKYEKSIDCLL